MHTVMVDRWPNLDGLSGACPADRSIVIRERPGQGSAAPDSRLIEHGRRARRPLRSSYSAESTKDSQIETARAQ